MFRHFPLTQALARAARAAMAAESAAVQEKFWDMHDLLFENQDVLEEEDLLRYAETLDLDVEEFAAELDHEERLNHVREDFVSGVRAGVNGTPTFFINGVRYEGSHQPRDFRRALTDASRAA